MLLLFAGARTISGVVGNLTKTLGTLTLVADGTVSGGTPPAGLILAFVSWNVESTTLTTWKDV